jgi:hypothetical protein
MAGSGDILALDGPHRHPVTCQFQNGARLDARGLVDEPRTAGPLREMLAALVQVIRVA